MGKMAKNVLAVGPCRDRAVGPCLSSPILTTGVDCVQCLLHRSGLKTVCGVRSRGRVSCEVGCNIPHYGHMIVVGEGLMGGGASDGLFRWGGKRVHTVHICPLFGDLLYGL